jgi:hypothetical protein
MIPSLSVASQKNAPPQISAVHVYKKLSTPNKMKMIKHKKVKPFVKYARRPSNTKINLYSLLRKVPM